MKTGLVLQRCARILTDAQIVADPLTTANFLDYADLVRDVILAWPEKQRATNDVKDFAKALRQLRDSYGDEIASDPMAAYLPAHDIALDFHKSTAFIRYFRGGNRISKTESARADNYQVVTNQMTYRPAPPLPASIFIVGVNYKDYAPEVFEKKYIHGEPGNPLTPAFPVGGKWLYKYDEKKKIVYIACEECANKGNAGSCHHEHSTIHLFSDAAPRGHEAIAGGQYSQGQFDEHVQQRFLTEALKRLETVPMSSFMITGTPLQGKGAWEHQRITRLIEERPQENFLPGTERKYASIHTIDQFSAGLADPALIEGSMKIMSPAEAEARVWGRPAAFSETSVFDQWELSEMYEDVEAPNKGFIVFDVDKENTKSEEDLLVASSDKTKFIFVPDESSLLSVWEPPRPHHQYILGADVAQGLRDGDASCCEVLSLTRQGTEINFEQVAEYHGWINPENYADDLMKLAIWYNCAPLVVERRGPGDRSIQRLKQLGYWNLFQDLSDPATAQFSPDSLLGIDTNVKSKGIIISALQQAIKDRRTGKRTIIVRNYSTIEELGHYGQELTSTGLSYRFRGQGGSHDDRVMGLALSVYAVKAYPEIYCLDTEVKKRNNQTQLPKPALNAQETEFWEKLQKELKDDARTASDPFYDG